ncbi:MAG: translation elongation factor Ts [Candidatus Dasytiphilus stammeri]
MINITSAMVKMLRARTGAGLMFCKKALIEAKGDIEIAIDYMRKIGQIQADQKKGRLALEGIILVKIENNYGVIVELNCETDFVSKNKKFIEFGINIINTAIIERINNIKILNTKFETERISLITKFGENINIRRIAFLEGDSLTCYLHNFRIGVIVLTSINTRKELCKHIAMHIAASNPEYVTPQQIPIEVREREMKIQREIIRKQQPSKLDYFQKIIEGRMNKFIREISLTTQSFIFDPKVTVGELLTINNIEVMNFIRFELGESINFVANIKQI